MQINIVGALSSSMSKFPAIQKINLAHGTPYCVLILNSAAQSRVVDFEMIHFAS